MIIRDLDIMSIVVEPLKANAPLVIDANTVLTGSVSRQFLPTIRRRNAQVIERSGVVQHAELSQSDLLNTARQLTRMLAGEDLLSLFVFEALYHGWIIKRPNWLTVAGNRRPGLD